MTIGTVELIQGLLIAFLLVVVLMPPYIRFARHFRFGKRIRVEGPESHYLKEGTPTGAGILIVLVVAAVAVLLGAVGSDTPDTYSPLAALLGVAALGAFDDYLNVRTGDGIKARHKLIWLIVVAVLAALYIQRHFGIDAIRVPFEGDVVIGAPLWIIFAAFAIVAASNGVNITDGLDGLAGGTTAFAYVAYMIIALLNVPHEPNLALLCAIIIGATVGYLWFNVHPAQVLMGDAGSLSLGACLAVIALITGQIVVLPLIGIVFVVETGSVILQVAYFKATGGKRIFRMSPIHHHFELSGWNEEKITVRFWIVGVLAGLIGVTLFLASINRLA
jgi:phospho-N-acetylmuramoyl-pentapeptide-transferase